MTVAYKILSADTKNGTFVIQFDGLEPLNFFIPHNETAFLTGADLENAIQEIYKNLPPPNPVLNFTNGNEIESLVQKDIELDKKQLAELVRRQRDSLLIKSDWTQLPNAQLTNEQKIAWENYRQELRDLPNQPNFPNEVNFPLAPQ